MNKKNNNSSTKSFVIQTINKAGSALIEKVKCPIARINKINSSSFLKQRKSNFKTKLERSNTLNDIKKENSKYHSNKSKIQELFANTHTNFIQKMNFPEFSQTFHHESQSICGINHDLSSPHLYKAKSYNNILNKINVKDRQDVKRANKSKESEYDSDKCIRKPQFFEVTNGRKTIPHDLKEKMFHQNKGKIQISFSKCNKNNKRNFGKDRDFKIKVMKKGITKKNVGENNLRNLKNIKNIKNIKNQNNNILNNIPIQFPNESKQKFDVKINNENILDSKLEIKTLLQQHRKEECSTHEAMKEKLNLFYKASDDAKCKII